mgnify:CR=1 FL=1
MNAVLQAKNLSKIYGRGESEVRALNRCDLTFEEGGFTAIVGRSGSGKTTLLHLLGGLDMPTTGTVLLEGRDIYALSDKQRTILRRRRIGFVFQFYNLVPELTAWQNIVLPLNLDGRRPDAEYLNAVVETLGLTERLGHFAGELSGGQQQRVAIARALANHPKVLLLDEPLAALDLKLRKDMQVELKNIQKSLGITFIYVTHDQEEALSMSDTVVVMDGGEIQQIGTPQDIYNEPKNAFVADFIGESNILDGVMHEDYLVEFFGRKFKCLDAGFAQKEPVDVVIRPEDIDIVEPDKGHLIGTVTGVTFKGVHYETIVDFKGFKWLIQTTDYYAPDTVIGIVLNPEDIHIMKKSAYSGMFGDYSSYSEEFEEMADPEADLVHEESEEDNG